MMEQQQHFIFGEAKVKFETGPETGPLGDSVSVQDVADVLVSKMMWYDGNVKYFSIYAKYFLRYPGNMDFAWGSVDSVHCVGSYWAPGFANYLILFQVYCKYFYLIYARYFLNLRQQNT